MKRFHPNEADSGIILPYLNPRTGGTDELYRIAEASDRRKSALNALHKERGTKFGSDQQYSGVIDAFHGETHFGLEEQAKIELERAWSNILDGSAAMRERSGALYDKKFPQILRELSATKLFGRLRDPAPGLDGLEVRADDVIVCPYTSTILLEEALATIARPGGSLICPEGFYKNNIYHLAKFGMSVEAVPMAKDRDYKIDCSSLANKLRELKRDRLCGLLLTLPGNPVLSEYSQSEMEELAFVIAEAEVPVICDASFDRMLPTHIPLPSMSVSVNGRQVSLYDRTIYITGNSKSYNAIGPFKFGAACTGNREWRERIAARLSIPMQRETTHLIRTLMEHTSEEYFDRNCAEMSEQHVRARRLIRNLEETVGTGIIRPFSNSLNGMFLNIEISSRFMENALVRDSLELEDFLMLAQGINSVCFQRMGSQLQAVRLNIASPRKHGVKSPDHLDELFDRIGAFLRGVQSGTTYPDVLNAMGVPKLVTK